MKAIANTITYQWVLWRQNSVSNIKILQKRLDEAEEMTLRGGKKNIFKLKQKFNDLQSEYDDELGMFSI